MPPRDLGDLSIDELLQLAIALKQGGYALKHDATGVGSTSGFYHGPGGLLTYPGVDPTVISTIIGTLPGLINQLPTRASRYMNPVFETITGIGADSGSETRDACDPAIVGGITSGCKHTFPFGRVERQTREVEINRLGQLINRSEPIDLRLVGGATLGTPWQSANFPPAANFLNSDAERLFYERAVSFARKLNLMLWTGNPSNNAGTGYREFAGIEILLNRTDGWDDAETGSACAATAPDIKDFHCARIDSEANGTLLVRYITYMVRYLKDKAERQGLVPVRWAFVMRPSAFYEITNVWPCSYITYVCQSTNSNYTYNVELAAQARLRDEMRVGRYLLVDGERIDVILGDAITEHNNGEPPSGETVSSGCFCSDIYLIPFSVAGGLAVTYLQHFDYNNPDIRSLAGTPLGLFTIQGNGAFIETIRQTNWCVIWQAKIEPRLIMRTPQLAGRLKNVSYCPLQNPDQPFPSDPYYRAGGETSRPGPSPYYPW